MAKTNFVAHFWAKIFFASWLLGNYAMLRAVNAMEISDAFVDGAVTQSLNFSIYSLEFR